MSEHVVWFDPAGGGTPFEYRSNELTVMIEVTGVF
jgi:hypothetical protein